MKLWRRPISATVREVAGGGELGGGVGDVVETLGGRELGDGDGGVAEAQPAISRTNAKGMVNRRVQAFMALVRAGVPGG